MSSHASSVVEGLVAKLGHDLWDIRAGAVHSLHSKLSHGLLQASDLLGSSVATGLSQLAVELCSAALVSDSSSNTQSEAVALLRSSLNLMRALCVHPVFAKRLSSESVVKGIRACQAAGLLEDQFCTDLLQQLAQSGHVHPATPSSDLASSNHEQPVNVQSGRASSSSSSSNVKRNVVRPETQPLERRRIKLTVSDKEFLSEVVVRLHTTEDAIVALGLEALRNQAIPHFPPDLLLRFPRLLKILVALSAPPLSIGDRLSERASQVLLALLQSLLAYCIQGGVDWVGLHDCLVQLVPVLYHPRCTKLLPPLLRLAPMLCQQAPPDTWQLAQRALSSPVWDSAAVVPVVKFAAAAVHLNMLQRTNGTDISAARDYLLPLLYCSGSAFPELRGQLIHFLRNRMPRELKEFDVVEREKANVQLALQYVAATSTEEKFDAEAVAAGLVHVLQRADDNPNAHQLHAIKRLLHDASPVVITTMLRSACPALAQSCYEVTEELVGEHTFDSSSLATLVLCAVFDSCSDVDDSRGAAQAALSALSACLSPSDAVTEAVFLGPSHCQDVLGTGNTAPVSLAKRLRLLFHHEERCLESMAEAFDAVCTAEDPITWTFAELERANTSAIELSDVRRVLDVFRNTSLSSAVRQAAASQLQQLLLDRRFAQLAAAVVPLVLDELRQCNPSEHKCSAECKHVSPLSNLQLLCTCANSSPLQDDVLPILAPYLFHKSRTARALALRTVATVVFVAQFSVAGVTLSLSISEETDVANTLHSLVLKHFSLPFSRSVLLTMSTPSDARTAATRNLSAVAQRYLHESTSPCADTREDPLQNPQQWVDVLAGSSSHQSFLCAVDRMDVACALSAKTGGIVMTKLLDSSQGQSLLARFMCVSPKSGQDHILLSRLLRFVTEHLSMCTAVSGASAQRFVDMVVALLHLLGATPQPTELAHELLYCEALHESLRLLGALSLWSPSHASDIAEHKHVRAILLRALDARVGATDASGVYADDALSALRQRCQLTALVCSQQMLGSCGTYSGQWLSVLLERVAAIVLSLSKQSTSVGFPHKGTVKAALSAAVRLFRAVSVQHADLSVHAPLALSLHSVDDINADWLRAFLGDRDVLVRCLSIDACSAALDAHRHNLAGIGHAQQRVHVSLVTSLVCSLWHWPLMGVFAPEPERLQVSAMMDAAASDPSHRVYEAVCKFPANQDWAPTSIPQLTSTLQLGAQLLVSSWTVDATVHNTHVDTHDEEEKAPVGPVAAPGGRAEALQSILTKWVLQLLLSLPGFVATFPDPSAQLHLWSLVHCLAAPACSAEIAQSMAGFTLVQLKNPVLLATCVKALHPLIDVAEDAEQAQATPAALAGYRSVFGVIQALAAFDCSTLTDLDGLIPWALGHALRGTAVLASTQSTRHERQLYESILSCVCQCYDSLRDQPALQASFADSVVQAAQGQASVCFRELQVRYSTPFVAENDRTLLPLLARATDAWSSSVSVHRQVCRALACLMSSETAQACVADAHDSSVSLLANVVPVCLAEVDRLQVTPCADSADKRFAEQDLLCSHLVHGICALLRHSTAARSHLLSSGGASRLFSILHAHVGRVVLPHSSSVSAVRTAEACRPDAAVLYVLLQLAQHACLEVSPQLAHVVMLPPANTRKPLSAAPVQPPRAPSALLSCLRRLLPMCSRVRGPLLAAWLATVINLTRGADDDANVQRIRCAVAHTSLAPSQNRRVQAGMANCPVSGASSILTLLVELFVALQNQQDPSPVEDSHVLSSVGVCLSQLIAESTACTAVLKTSLLPHCVSTMQGFVDVRMNSNARRRSRRTPAVSQLQQCLQLLVAVSTTEAGQDGLHDCLFGSTDMVGCVVHLLGRSALSAKRNKRVNGEDKCLLLLLALLRNVAFYDPIKGTVLLKRVDRLSQKAGDDTAPPAAAARKYALVHVVGELALQCIRSDADQGLATDRDLLSQVQLSVAHVLWVLLYNNQKGVAQFKADGFLMGVLSRLYKHAVWRADRVQASPRDSGAERDDSVVETVARIFKVLGMQCMR